MVSTVRILLLGLVIYYGPLFIFSVNSEPRNAISMHDKPLYSEGFQNFSYTNPNAPKGGSLNLAAMGRFDSLNPFINDGNPAAGLREYVFESLMARSYEEPFSLYGLIAQTIDVAEDNSWVAFTIRKEAKFSDGNPITADDIIFSLKTLRKKGRNNHISYYSKVDQIVRIDSHNIKFIFNDSSDKELPLIIGLMPVLSKKYFSDNEFSETSLKKPVGSGPYLIGEIVPGSMIKYIRNKNYWGWNLPVNKGRYNFDNISYEYYQDSNAAFASFRNGITNFRYENDPTLWVKGYNFPAVKEGNIITKSFDLGIPSGMQAFVFNTRRKVFSDIKVRKAILHAFNFELINRKLFYGVYKRINSYYDRSELSSYLQPASQDEKKLLLSFSEIIEKEIMSGNYSMPKSGSVSRSRSNYRKSLSLFSSAGYEIQDGVMRNKKTGEIFKFEILVKNNRDERIANIFSWSLKRLGIAVRVRKHTDVAQFSRRLSDYDFDMVAYRWFASLSPGNEQSFYWCSQGRNKKNTRNYMGVSEPIIDTIITRMISTKNRSEFVSMVRALDRVLLSGVYVIPLYYPEKQWVAYSSYLRHPKNTSLYGAIVDSWWVSPEHINK